jgi:hypothetical protein
MRSIEWHGKRSMKTCMRPVPAITDPVGARQQSWSAVHVTSH